MSTTEVVKKKRTDFSSPSAYAEHLGFNLQEPVTIEEIQKVFRYMPLNPAVLIVDREMPPEQAGSIYVPDSVRKDRQTGAPMGRILWAGKEAREELQDLITNTGYDYSFTIGDSVGFNVIHPQPLGLMWHGTMIMPGFDTSRYSGIEIVHWNDVRGYIPAADLD